jgi:hypothetical protein
MWQVAPGSLTYVQTSTTRELPAVSDRLGCNRGGWLMDHDGDLQHSLEDGTYFLPIIILFNSSTKYLVGIKTKQVRGGTE